MNIGSSWKSLFGKFSWRDFLSFKTFFRSAWWGWLVFLFWVTAVTFLLSFEGEQLPSDYRVGKVASTTLKADRNYDIIDKTTTEASRHEASQAVLPVLDWDVSLVEKIKGEIQEAFRAARLVAGDEENLEKPSEIFQGVLSINLDPQLKEDLDKAGYSKKFEAALMEGVDFWMGQKILFSLYNLPVEEGRSVTVRSLPEAEEELALVWKKDQNLWALDSIKKKVKQGEKFNTNSLNDLEKKSLLSLAPLLVEANTHFNDAETRLREDRAANSVPNVVIKIQVGEVIIRSGDRFEPYHLTILEGIRAQKTRTNYVVKLVGIFLFVSLLFLATYAFAGRYIRKFYHSRQDLYFLGLVLLMVLAVVRIGDGLVQGLELNIPLTALYYAIPVAAGAMLTRYVLNSETAIIFSIVASALSGFFLQGDLDLSIYYLFSSMVASSAVAHVDRRSAILKAGLIVGVLNALMILAIKLVNVFSVAEAFSLREVTVPCSLGLLGGLLSAMLVLVLAPIVEMIFDYVTDIKLLELGNLNHPLLQEMIVKAPGTYHHSQLVAVLSEAAAAAVGANPLLARVGSYFHDVGKMRKPAYFIENQQSGVNRHDDLSPSMSALIIASHVKDGLEMAKEHKLPQRIIDFIPQHQGTKLISFFYNKALKLAEENNEKDKVDEKHYRYPGPRPQNREAGIILLADGVEASVRSLKEKTPHKIRAKVQQLINSNFIEEQLDECDLTLRDLHEISETFTRVLVGIYHNRIEYPEDMPKPGQATVTPLKKVAV